MLKTIEISVLLKIKIIIADMRCLNLIKQQKNAENEKAIRKC